MQINKYMKKLTVILILLLAAALAAVITCPDRQDHVDAIKAVVSEKLQEEIGSGQADDLVSIFGNAIGSKVTDWLMDSRLTVKNRFVYSVGEFNTFEGPKTVSVGVFGHVFTFSKEDIDKALQSIGSE